MIDKKKFVKNLKIREKYFKYVEFSREDKAKIHRVRDIPLPAPELQKLLPPLLCVSASSRRKPCLAIMQTRSSRQLHYPSRLKFKREIAKKVYQTSKFTREPEFLSFLRIILKRKKEINDSSPKLIDQFPMNSKEIFNSIQ